jgi:hypothetical protein
LRYLVIAALLFLFLLLLYSRVRPYIQAIKKVMASLQGGAQQATGETRSSAKVESKLVRCVACGTWIPANRVISAMGSSAFCSRECLEKPPKEHKAAS